MGKWLKRPEPPIIPERPNGFIFNTNGWNELLYYPKTRTFTAGFWLNEDYRQAWVNEIGGNDEADNN